MDEISRPEGMQPGYKFELKLETAELAGIMERKYKMPLPDAVYGMTQRQIASPSG